MKKIILTHGLIAGTIVAGMMLITMPLYKSGTLTVDNGELVGYTTMVIALSMVFFGIKSFRDNHQNGAITFGRGLKVGVLITVIASIMYALAWEVSYNSIGEEFTQKMKEHYVKKMEAKGATPEEISKAKEKMYAFVDLYRNPFVRIGITLFEIFPIGLVISLISAGLLRKKEFLPAG